MEHMGWEDHGLLENLDSVSPKLCRKPVNPSSLAKFRRIFSSSWRAEEKMIGSHFKSHRVVERLPSQARPYPHPYSMIH